jgi:hypothetical protein
MRRCDREIEDRHAEELEEARASEAAALAYVESRTSAFDSAAGEFQLRHDTLRRLLDFADDSVGWRRPRKPEPGRRPHSDGGISG